MYFQGVLFLGYLSAHLLHSYFSLRVQGLVYIILSVLSVLSIDILPWYLKHDAYSDDPSIAILFILTTSIGLPYFILSTISPMIQAWFATTIKHGSPYRLYALSNLGSALALLTYPFVFEPNLTIFQQANMWESIYYVLSVLLLCLGTFLLVTRKNFDSNKGKSKASVDDVHISMTFLWLMLPFLTSVLLISITSYISRDIAVIPFLWIVPLFLFLLSFVICFDTPEFYKRRFFFYLAVCCGAIILISFHRSSNSIPLMLGVSFIGFFAFCMLGHGELARIKPHKDRLTLFYLMLSFGGALGGVFVVLVAPKIFDSCSELPLSIAFLSLIGFITIGIYKDLNSLFSRSIFCIVSSWFAIAAIIAIFPGLIDLSKGDQPLYVKRDFFGTSKVKESQWETQPQTFEKLRIFYHGTIIHGLQFLDEGKARLPTTYYGSLSAVGQTLEQLKNENDSLKVGIIGLGVGTISAYARDADEYKYYELNPTVQGIAESHFSYLSSSRGSDEIVIGDARISLENEESNEFDVIILDAFSGDSIPIHLLTKEAFDLYLRHLKEEGVLLVHITNIYLDLTKPISSLSKYLGLNAAFLSYSSQDSNGTLNFPCTYALISRGDITPITSKMEGLQKSVPSTDLDFPLWTDSYSSLFEIVNFF